MSGFGMFGGGGIPSSLRKLVGISSSASEIDGKCTFNANTIVLDGDSIVRYNGYTNTYSTGNTTTLIDSKGFFVMGNAMLKNRFKVLANNGVGGETTAQILARIEQSISFGSKYIFVNGGTNDIGQGIEASVTKANLLSIYTKIIESGKICIGCTIPPRGSVDATYIAKTIEINSFLRDLTIDNFILIDFYKALVDTSTNIARTGMLLADNTHPNSTGATAMGYEVYKTLDTSVPMRNIFDGSNIGETIIVNPYFNGDTSGKANTWSFSGTAAYSKIARDYGLYWQQIITASLTNISISQICTTGFSVADTIKLYAELEIDSTTTSLFDFKLQINCLDAANATLQTIKAPYTDGSYTTFGKEFIGKSLIIETNNFIIPLNTAKLQVYLFSNLFGAIRIGKITSKKITSKKIS